MRTKIIATLGPASDSYPVMSDMVDAGCRIFRLNFSHADAAAFEPTVKIIRRLEDEKGLVLTALADLCGPKIRIGEVRGAPVDLYPGEKVCFGLPEEEGRVPEGVLFLSLAMPEALAGLAEGAPVSLSDGMLQFAVSSVLVPDRLFELTAGNAGLLTSHKGVAFPGRTLALSALTAKDRKDACEALAIGVDALALSFVQTPQDVLDLRAAIAGCGRFVPIVVKVERRAAVDGFEAILDVADAVMVARGDLGVEYPPSDLPIIQKLLIGQCRRRDTPVIVATQMLLSMVQNPLPTRAEATDVANAILDGADCVMLSEETTIGKHPVKAVEYMGLIAAKTEGYMEDSAGGPAPLADMTDPERTLAHCACLLAEQTKAAALACHTRSGVTARRVSGRRPRQPIYALTPDAAVKHLLNFSWGVAPVEVKPTEKSHLRRVESFVATSPRFAQGQAVVITAGQKTPGRKDQHTNEVKVYYK